MKLNNSSHKRGKEMVTSLIHSPEKLSKIKYTTQTATKRLNTPDCSKCKHAALNIGVR